MSDKTTREEELRQHREKVTADITKDLRDKAEKKKEIHEQLRMIADTDMPVERESVALIVEHVITLMNSVSKKERAFLGFLRERLARETWRPLTRKQQLYARRILFNYLEREKHRQQQEGFRNNRYNGSCGGW